MAYSYAVAIELNLLKFLLLAKKKGANFDRTLMLGRQALFGIEPHEMLTAFRAFGCPGKDAEITKVAMDRGYAEPLLRLLGATHTDSMDGSDYEGASIVHDLNAPIPDRLRSSYSVVFDGGTLEHVFDFPTALRSAMKMVQVGGHYIGMSPANNFMGHGLYQFSPELFLRAFSEGNGFSIERMVLVEHFSDSWFEVVRPERLDTGLQSKSVYPTLLFTIARKTHDAEPFLTVPQQSSYEAQWSEQRSSGRPSLIQTLLGFAVKRPRLYRVLYRAAMPLHAATALRRRSAQMRQVRPEAME